MPLDLFAVERLLGAGQRVVWCHREHEVDRSHLLQAQAAAGRKVGRHAECQVGLAVEQRLPGARQGLGAQAQPGRRAQRIEGLAELEQRAAGDQRVGRDRQLGLPAGRDPAHPLRDRVELEQQMLAGAQQLGAGRRQAGAARAAVEQQHVERVLDLAHPVGQCAGHQAELARRRRHAAGAGDGLDQVEVLGREGGQLSLHVGVPVFTIFELCRQNAGLNRPDPGPKVLSLTFDNEQESPAS